MRTLKITLTAAFKYTVHNIPMTYLVCNWNLNLLIHFTRSVLHFLCF